MYLQEHGEEPDPPALYPRAVPDDFPDDVPLFEGGRLIGSLAHGDQIRVVLFTDGAADEVMAWYRARMTEAGWAPAERDERHHGGFMTHPPGEEQVMVETFCRTPSGPSLLVRIMPQEPIRVIELTVNRSTDPEFSPCTVAERNRRMYRQHDMHDPQVLPSLQAPPGAKLVPGGGSGSSGRRSSSARLMSELSLGELLAHYNAELERAGWQKLEDFAAHGAALSCWRFSARELDAGFGLLTIIRAPDDDWYALEISALWQTPESLRRWKSAGVR
jgi:hypothetical protein